MSGVVTGPQILTDGRGVLGEGLLWGWVAAPEAKLHRRLSQCSENHLCCPKSSLASQPTPTFPDHPQHSQIPKPRMGAYSQPTDPWI